jgi:hypothetical protein
MSKNQKNSNTYKWFRKLSSRLSMFVMAATATIGVMDMQNDPRLRVIVPNQPTFAVETNNTELLNPILREKEETGPHYVSYSVSQRTPSRHGKR